MSVVSLLPYKDDKTALKLFKPRIRVSTTGCQSSLVLVMWLLNGWSLVFKSNEGCFRVITKSHLYDFKDDRESFSNWALLLNSAYIPIQSSPRLVNVICPVRQVSNFSGFAEEKQKNLACHKQFGISQNKTSKEKCNFHIQKQIF